MDKMEKMDLFLAIFSSSQARGKLCSAFSPAAAVSENIDLSKYEEVGREGNFVPSFFTAPSFDQK